MLYEQNDKQDYKQTYSLKKRLLQSLLVDKITLQVYEKIEFELCTEEFSLWG